MVLLYRSRRDPRVFDLCPSRDYRDFETETSLNILDYFKKKACQRPLNKSGIQLLPERPM